MIDKLIEQIIEKKSPICVGLDTKFDYVPQEFLSHEYSTDPLTYAADNIFRYNCALVDVLADIVPAVKVQAAYYEMYGCAGMVAFRD
ncbi:MAG: orotidine 5'-phosphate decarboxylase, partial [Christensenella sp.]